MHRAPSTGRGANLPSVGGFNRSVLLDLIRRAPQGLSRVELAAVSGLSSQTVTNVTRRLLDAGLIREGARIVAGPGKPRTLLSLEPSGGYAVGVHLDPTWITYVVVDLEGAVVAEARAHTPRDPQPDEVLGQMEKAIGALVDASGAAPDRLHGVGIASPGPIDSAGGVVLDPPMLANWRHVPLRSALAERLRRPILLEKDVSAAATGELWASRDRSDMAFLYYGTGSGLGIVQNGEVVRGVSGNAGDIGHVVVSDDSRICSCGRRGCLAMTTSPGRMVEEAAAAGVVAAPALGDSLDIDHAFSALAELALAGDGDARRVFASAARGLARGLLVIANILDVERIVAGGPYWDRFASVGLEDLRRAIATDPVIMTPHPVRIESTRLGSDVAAVGAACLVLDAVHSPKPSGLLIGD